MRAHGGGAIVNIAPISGQRGNLGRSAYVTGHILNVDGGFAAGGYLPVRA